MRVQSQRDHFYTITGGTMKNITKSLVIVGLMGFMSVSGAEAAEQAVGCQQVVQSIKNEWKAVDFATPSKPTAMRVQGKLGHENTAAQVAYMKEQIKKADADCKSGNQQVALQRVNSVRDMLDAHGMSEETANAAMIQK